MGVNTGFCTVGNFGSVDRLDYTVIGNPVNLAARLQSRAERGGILMSAEAEALVNGTDYGLGGGLWTRDLQRAHRFASAFRSGMVWINCYKRVNPGSPFGGFGQSGYGREMGFEAMHDYTEAKSVWVNVDAEIPPWYPR